LTIWHKVGQNVTLNIRNIDRQIMKIVVFSLSILVLFITLSSLTPAYSIPTVTIETSQETYHYCDKLSITVNVSEITGDVATIYIINPEEGKSILLSPPISAETTELPARFAFGATIWDPGTYTLEIEYSETASSVQFSIDDNEEICLPYWIKDVAYMWISEPTVTDKDFARALGFLIEQEIIKIPYTSTGDETVTKIPDWVKTNAEWWITDQISDTEFTLSLQYLIEKGIILVNTSAV
jgi:hypothetical protein